MKAISLLYWWTLPSLYDANEYYESPRQDLTYSGSQIYLITLMGNNRNIPTIY